MAGTTIAALLLLLLATEPRMDSPAPISRVEHAGADALPAMRTPVAPPSAPPSASAVAVAPPIESIQICGGEWVRTKADGSVDEAAIRALPGLRAGTTRLLERLRSSPDELGRAAALLLESLSSLSVTEPSTETDAQPCEGPCMQARMLEWRQERTSRLEPLARQAVDTQDPRVYALAYRACPEHAESGACAMLSAEQWARVDADNAVPWLHLVGEASERRDDAARDEALFRFGKAGRYQTYWMAATARLVDEVRDDDALQVPALELAAGLAGIEAASRVSNLQAISEACRDVTMAADPNRWQLCSAAAEQLAERSDSQIDRLIGISVARRLGWPEERTDRLLGEVVDLRRAQLAASGASTDPRVELGCAAVRRQLADIAALGHLGEMAAMRASLGASAASPSDYARIGREERERRALMQAQAASQAATRTAAASQPVLSAR